MRVSRQDGTVLVMGRMSTRVSAWIRSPAADAVLALALAAHSQLEIWWPALTLGGSNASGLKAVLVPTALLATLPLALRRQVPFAVLCIVMGAVAFQALLT